MWKGFGFSQGAGAEPRRGESGRSAVYDDEYGEDDEDEDRLDDAEYEGDGGDDAWGEPEPERYERNILSSDGEKSKVLVMFRDLRKDEMFCDITFLCQGKEFRAHKVVVSAWSRWLKALLCEEQPSEDVIHLDVFDPLSFGKVLDYMYGTPLTATIETAEALLKVVHRLQLQDLEESIWIFLMQIVDPNNAEQLHTLADRYDCPPLKLSAWRIMQEAIPGYTSLPAGVLAASAAAGVFKGTGLIGPGDADFLTNLPASDAFPGVHDEDRADDLPSIFTHFTPPPPGEDGEDDEEGDDYYGDEDNYEHKREQPARNPKELPPNASATELVKAWSARLQEVYQKCNAPEGENFADPDTMAAERGKKIIVSGGAAGGGRASPKAGPRGGKGGGSSSGSPTKYKHIREVDWRAELRQFYLGVNMPEKLPGIGEILLTWKGKEEQMLSHLMTKYKRSIQPALADHLNTLLAYVETQTESSFVR